MDRAPVLQRLLVGDIFHAKAENGASFVCLTTNITENYITARTVTSQLILQFSRGTGVSEDENGKALCVIDSCAPLPIDIHQVMLGLDRKFRLWDDLTKLALSHAEKQAILFVHGYYLENPT
jgi:hypothetical protein